MLKETRGIQSDDSGDFSLVHTCLADNTLIKLTDNPKIYVINQCKKKWIRTAQEFNQGGYSWSNVNAVSREVFDAYLGQEQETGTPTPTLIRAIGHHRVYRIINNKKLWIPAISAFNAQGLKWEDVQETNESEVNNYNRIKLIRVIGGTKVYYITESGLRRHIPSAEVFLSYNNRWEDIVEVDDNIINSYEDSILIRLEGGSKVYLLQNNIKHWIKTAQIFNQHNHDWNKISLVNEIEIDGYEEGEVVE